MLPWTKIINRLIKIMDRPGETYFSGPRFLGVIREVDEDCPRYTEYLDERRARGQSTTRRIYFEDILKGLNDRQRLAAVNAILDVVQPHYPDEAFEIRNLMGGGTSAPTAAIPAEAWNSTRLNDYLHDIDGAIAANEYERAVSLSYTCLEGFLGAFIRAKSTRDSYPTEIIALSKEVREHLKTSIGDYPDEVLNGISQAAHAIDKSRNRFSESHFANAAGSWLAIYVRDLVNTQIRLLLHFM